MSVPRRHPLLRRDINLGCKHTGEKRKGRRNCILFSLVAVMSSVLLRGIDCNNWLNNSGRLASTMERGGGKEGNDWQHNLLSHLVPPPRKDSLSKPPVTPPPLLSWTESKRPQTPRNPSPVAAQNLRPQSLWQGKNVFTSLQAKEHLCQTRISFLLWRQKRTKDTPFFALLASPPSLPLERRHLITNGPPVMAAIFFRPDSLPSNGAHSGRGGEGRGVFQLEKRGEKVKIGLLQARATEEAEAEKRRGFKKRQGGEEVSPRRSKVSIMRSV